MTADDDVNVGDLLGDLHVHKVAGMAHCDEDVDPLALEFRGFVLDSLDLVKDLDAFRAGNVGSLLGQIADDADLPSANCHNDGLGDASVQSWLSGRVDVGCENLIPSS